MKQPSMAQLSVLDDAALWEMADTNLPEEQQADLQMLLDRQRNSDTLSSDDAMRLQTLMDSYGRYLVRKSHAWLLLARRGYKVPTQS
ncbi:MAG: hypothetical protein AAF614_10945 [Chloroflexota bacterium]